MKNLLGAMLVSVTIVGVVWGIILAVSKLVGLYAWIVSTENINLVYAFWTGIAFVVLTFVFWIALNDDSNYD